MVVGILFGIGGGVAAKPKPGVQEPGKTMAGADEPGYASNRIIIKFKKETADTVASELAGGKKGNQVYVSPSIDALNRYHKLKRMQPVFPNFKKNQEKIEKLRTKDETTLTRKEARILYRFSRAPKDAKIPALDRIYTLEIELVPGQSLQEVVAIYDSSVDVEYAELDYMVTTCFEPNDTLYDYQWALHNTGQDFPKSGKHEYQTTPDADIDGPGAWNCPALVSSIVAVIDTGVDYNHRDLQGNIWMNDAEANGSSGVDDDDNGYVDDIFGYDCINDDNDPIDDRGHGTHCAGIIAAESDNGTDIAGVSRGTEIMSLKFLGSDGKGSSSDAVEAIYYAVANGADILSNSWGSRKFNQSLQDAINYAHDQGCIFVAAAGNWDSRLPNSYPAAMDNVFSVAATEPDDDKASFSNYGNWVDIAAPGVDILSLRANGTSRGTVYDAYTTIASGTSMACPHVAGSCAYILSAVPPYKSEDVEDLLMETADPISERICASGRLNLANAIQVARGIGVHNTTQDKWYVYINDAIDEASDFDEIKVYEGRYAENVDFDGKAFTLTSTDPDDWETIENTIIDAASSGDGVTFSKSEDSNSVITGFTITGADSSGDYGIYCYGTSPAISRCIVTGNKEGIKAIRSSPVVDACKVHNNTKRGFKFIGGSPTVKNSFVYENKWGIVIGGGGSPTITNNTVVNNTTKGIDSWRPRVVYNNTRDIDKGPGREEDPTITNCILWGNTDDLYEGFTATYSCIGEGIGGPNDNNISIEPDFVDAANDDYHLKPISPCIDVGDPDGTYTGQVDIDGEPCVLNGQVDIGADEVGCVAHDSPFYSEWIYWGAPDCWCYERNCRGDADGLKIGMFWVQTNDQAIFTSAFCKADANIPAGGICADLDHKKVGLFRVQSTDLDIFTTYFNKGPFNVPECPTDWDGDSDDDYNFWTN